MPVTGGEKASAYLAKISSDLKARKYPTVQVGFFENAKYEDGTYVATVAFINEFGARIEREPSTTTVYRKVNAAGTEFLRNGRFVKKKDSNFASDHYVGAYVVKIPPRPFFRNMISKYSGTWGDEAAKRLVSNNYNMEVTLTMMGELISGQLRQSITDLMEPPNAPSTIAKKGFDKPLIDTGFMRKSTGYEVIGL